MKPLLWMCSSKADLLMFPGDARRDAGFQLRKVQRGAEATSQQDIELARNRLKAIPRA